MNSNGSRFWGLSAEAHWPSLAGAGTHLGWHAGCGGLRLASERELAPPADAVASEAAALAALDEVPRALDAEGVVCSWHAASGAVVVRSHLPDAAVALRLPLAPGEAPSDLCVSTDGVLCVALPGRLLLHDLRRRWDDVQLGLAGFQPWRLAAVPGAAGGGGPGGVWVLERGSGRLAHLRGLPLPRLLPAADDFAPGVFRPDPENPRAPALQLVIGAWPDGAAPPLALCHHAGAGLLLLAWASDGQALLRRWDDAAARLGPACRLRGAWHAHAITALDGTPDGGPAVALRLPGRVDAPAYGVAPLGLAVVPPELPALGSTYPLAADHRQAAFVHRLDGPAHYPVRDDAAEPLLPLSLPSLARQGQAANYRRDGSQLHARLIDSGTPANVWHRLYLEANIPAGCGVTAWLAATNDPAPPPDDLTDAWHPHAFGADARQVDAAARAPHVPQAVWERQPSELPTHPGLARWTPLAPWRGLFSVLVQNARARVRSLAGRYLWVRLVLHGDGRASPEIVALRAWGGRFDYAEHYLPRVYRETLFGPEAQAPGERLDSIDEGHAGALDLGGPPAPALLERLVRGGLAVGEGAWVEVERPGRGWLLRDGTSARCWRLLLDGHAIGVYRPQASRADFLARTLANFEGVLTPLEDRVAQAHLLTDPDSVPEAHLDWLAGWVGLAFDPALPEARRRAWLRAAPELARWHGTRRGLLLALELATGGGVSGGEVVVIEDFRLRRVLATLLGVELGDPADPLLPGLVPNANSVVGDSLLLGERETAELLALYREEATSTAEDAAIADFHGRLAHRATVLVHREVDAVDLGMVRRIVEAQAPAHVLTRVVSASWPFMVGVASLVGVDSHLAPSRPLRPARVQHSALGMGDFVRGPLSLDPRLRGEAAPPVPPVQPMPAGPPPPSPAGPRAARPPRTPKRSNKP